MANASIFAAFERMWQHIILKFNNVVYLDAEDNENITTDVEAAKDELKNYVDDRFEELLAQSSAEEASF